MALRVLIVPDKFKGTLTAQAAAKAIAAGWHRARPDDLLDLLPMSDGGDGFGEVMSSALKAEPQTIRTVDAAHRTCAAKWWWVPKTRMAIIESAQIIGLAKLPPGKFHPFDLDTFGLGAVIQAAVEKEARHCVVGIGGSATNDGGFGLARALGWEFWDRDGKAIEKWTQLDKLLEIVAPARKRWFESLVVAVDVGNPLLGTKGCTRVYGPQKGLKKADYSLADRCLGKLATVAQQSLGRDFSSDPGAGAAGGLGFGFRSFLGARLQPGFELFAHNSGLPSMVRNANVVVTGEGSIDRSTMMGKGVGQLAEFCRKKGVACVGLGGTVLKKAGRFAQVHGLTELTSLNEAKAKPDFWLEKLAEQVAKKWQS